MRRCVVLIPLAMVWAGTANAAGVNSASRGGQPYSIYAGQTVGYNVNVVHAHAGWPGISGGILHGLTDRLDIGGTLTFNYGVEGVTDNAQAGLKAQFNTRFQLLDTGTINLGIHFDPGFIVYFYPGRVGTSAGLVVPVGLSLGVPVMSALLLHASFDIPLYFVFGDFSFTGIPILAGGGAEYFFNRDFSVNATFRVGPTILATGRGSTTWFTLYLLGGVAYKF